MKPSLYLIHQLRKTFTDSLPQQRCIATVLIMRKLRVRKAHKGTGS